MIMEGRVAGEGMSQGQHRGSNHGSTRTGLEHKIYKGQDPPHQTGSRVQPVQLEVPGSKWSTLPQGRLSTTELRSCGTSRSRPIRWWSTNKRRRR